MFRESAGYVIDILETNFELFEFLDPLLAADCLSNSSLQIILDCISSIDYKESLSDPIL